jgi:hypothetical protein
MSRIEALALIASQERGGAVICLDSISKGAGHFAGVTRASRAAS